MWFTLVKCALCCELDHICEQLERDEKGCIGCLSAFADRVKTSDMNYISEGGNTHREQIVHLPQSPKINNEGNISKVTRELNKA
jgi:hypothetical protein